MEVNRRVTMRTGSGNSERDTDADFRQRTRRTGVRYDISPTTHLHTEHIGIWKQIQPIQ